ncbi:hypothetical protein OHB24_35620 [Kribbella sp. NBC_00482]|uniref:hypothetical protein n=1 Tax=Kribbella sp. NBC_00482 TaxID=2975968 RepID=UPI002E186F6F
MTTTPRSSLMVGQRLADGGQGNVFALMNDAQQVFKEYHTPDHPAFRPDTLRQLVTERSKIRCEGTGIEAWTAWPLSVVTDGPRTVGFLMRRAPSDFILEVGGERKLADLGFLGSQPKLIWGKVQLPTVPDRIVIVRDLARVMDALHQQNIVIGDLSFANVLWAGPPQPRIMMLDCDGLRYEGREPVLPQAETPDWDDPQAKPHTRTKPTIDRDRYKLALAVLRVLTTSLDARPTPTTSLDPALFEQPDQALRVQDLLRRAGGSVGSRPTAKEWMQVLSPRPFTPVTPPSQHRPINAPPPRPDLLGVSEARIYHPVRPPGS